MTHNYSGVSMVASSFDFPKNAPESDIFPILKSDVFEKVERPNGDENGTSYDITSAGSLIYKGNRSNGEYCEVTVKQIEVFVERVPKNSKVPKPRPDGTEFFMFTYWLPDFSAFASILGGTSVHATLAYVMPASLSANMDGARQLENDLVIVPVTFAGPLRVEYKGAYIMTIGTACNQTYAASVHEAIKSSQSPIRDAYIGTPACRNASITTAAPPADDDNMPIIIGAGAGGGALALILCALAVCVCAKRKKNRTRSVDLAEYRKMRI